MGIHFLLADSTYVGGELPLAILGLGFLVLSLVFVTAIWLLSVLVRYPKQLRVIRIVLLTMGGAGLSFTAVRSFMIYTDNFNAGQALPIAQLAINVVTPAVFLFIFIFKNKFLGRNKPTFNGQGGVLPQFSPNVAATLANYYRDIKDRFSNKIVAAILELERKGILTVAADPNDKTDFVFRLLKKTDDLSKFEQAVFELLFSSKKECTGKRLNDKLRQEIGSVLFRDETDATITKRLVTADFAEFSAHNFFDLGLLKRQTVIKAVTFAFLFAVFAASFVLFMVGGSGWLLLYCLWSALIICGLWILLLRYSKKPLSVEGENAVAEVLALKRYYCDPTTMIKEQAAHLPYAAALGVADRIGASGFAQLGIYDGDIEKNFISATHKTFKFGMKTAAIIGVALLALAAGDWPGDIFSSNNKKTKK